MRVSIIGLGLVGGSLGGALRAVRYDVTGYDPSPAHAEIAVERGLVDRVSPSLDDALFGSAIVVLATPPDAIVSLLPRVARLVESDVILTDVGSVKRPVIDAMNQLPPGTRAVGGHPIAGRELSGPDAATPELFRNRPYAIVPATHSDPDSLDALSQLARAIGSVPIQLSASDHDATLARTSHLPQLLASALAISLADAGQPSSLSGPALRDMTRLAAGNPQLWSEILCLNADNVATSGRRFLGILSDLIDTIEAEDREVLYDRLELATRFQVPVAIS